jgi:cytochrome b subunit of formate dehydrogenase
MTFHLGSVEVVRAAILVHKLAIMLALAGIAVHVTMAAIVVEERPTLWSMILGQVSRRHAEEHAAKWVAELEQARGRRDEGSKAEASGEAADATNQEQTVEGERP